jgi:hypothetical protein
MAGLEENFRALVLWQLLLWLLMLLLLMLQVFVVAFKLLIVVRSLLL